MLHPLGNEQERLAVNGVPGDQPLTLKGRQPPGQLLVGDRAQREAFGADDGKAPVESAERTCYRGAADRARTRS